MTTQDLERAGFVLVDGSWRKPLTHLRQKPFTSAESVEPAKATKAVVHSTSYGDSAGVSTDEAKLNKTERAFLAWLRTQYQWVGVQCITLKLADDVRYVCDFWTASGMGMRGWEVKGWRWAKNIIKLKVAARIYKPALFTFTLVERIKGEWKFTEVKP